MSKTVRGWHFTSGWTLRDGTPLVVGRTYTVAGPLELRRHGLHFSERALDALKYAPNGAPCVVSRVEVSGSILRDSNKGCATRRRVLWAADCTRILQEFALTVAEDAAGVCAAVGIVVPPEAAEARRVVQECLAGRASANAVRASADAAQDLMLTMMLERLNP